VRWDFFSRKREAIGAEISRLEALVVQPSDVPAELLEKLGAPLTREAHAFDLLRRPQVHYDDLSGLAESSREVEAAAAAWRGDERLRYQVAQQVDVQAKYSGYLIRQSQEIERQQRHEELSLPADLDYAAVGGLSNEARQRLGDVRPETLGQAARIPGLTPAAVSLLLVHLKKRDRAA